MSEKTETGVRSLELATALEARITNGEIPIGVSLPAERDLMVDYQVSRTTVREALRILGARGLVEARRGRRGGSYVQAPSTDAVSRSLDLFIQGHDILFSDLLAAREAVEPVAAAQAAVRRSEDDLAELTDLAARMENAVEDIRLFSEVNVEFHLMIVKASHNPLFLSLMTAISSALFNATEREEFDLPTRQIVARAHRRIVEAIRDGDVDAARRRMQRHVTSYGDQLILENAAAADKTQRSAVA